jgi:hypothetical protein
MKLYFKLQLYIKIFLFRKSDSVNYTSNLNTENINRSNKANPGKLYYFP